MLLLTLGLGYVLLGEETADLDFEPRPFPEGFRDLVLNGRAPSTGVSPIAGLGPKTQIGAGQPTNICAALFEDTASPSIGETEAVVTVVEFSDYRCPYCKTLSPLLLRLQERYHFRLIFKEWPILGASSRLAARAALAADKQGKFRAVHKKLMQSAFVPTPAYMDDLATQLGMDRRQLSDDMRAPETDLALERTHALATALGLLGTPSLVVGRTIVQGAITQSQLEELIDNERANRHLNPCRTAG